MNNNTIVYQTIFSSQIYLNSANADIAINGTSKSNCVFFFKDALKIEKNAIEMRVSVVDAQIPVSWYLVNDTNNKLSITIADTTTTYTFPNGNYTAMSFIDMWYEIVGPKTQWYLQFSTLTNKMFIQNYTYLTFWLEGSILSLLGFPAGHSYVSAVTGKLNSPYCVNFSGINKLYIKSNTFNLKNIDSKNKGRSRAICAIPINNAYSGVIYYNNFTQYKSIFKNYELSSIQIEIQDDNKNYIDFNNVDWTMTLQVDIVCEVENNIDTLEDVYSNLIQEF